MTAEATRKELSDMIYKKQRDLFRHMCLPDWLRGAAKVRMDEAKAYPEWTPEHRRHAAIAAIYEHAAYTGDTDKVKAILSSPPVILP